MISLGELAENGYAHLGKVLSEQALQELKRAIPPANARTDAMVGTAKAPEITRSIFTNQKSAAGIVEVVEAARKRGLFDKFEVPIVEHVKVLVKAPHAVETPWHQDWAFWQDFDPACTMLSIWVALDEVNRENGCMRVLPGSHRGDVIYHVEKPGQELEIPLSLIRELGEAVDIPLKPGDAFVFHPKLVHMAYPNQTTRSRLAFKVVFQDLAKRPKVCARHPTSFSLDGVSGTINRVIPAVEAKSRMMLEKPVSRITSKLARTAKGALRRATGKRPDQVTLTDVFANLRAYQLNASEREWKQLMFYNEVLNLAAEVPGDVAEFGVAGGVSFVSFVRILDVLERGLDAKERRRVYGFDSFDGLPSLGQLDKSPVANNPEMRQGGFNDPKAYAELFAFVEKNPRAELVRGWFNESLPVFLADRPHISFSLVHVDCDLYESTKTVLEHVWNHVSPGGLIVFDELFHKDFPGETEAFREFFKGKAFTLTKSRVKPDKKILVKHGA